MRAAWIENEMLLTCPLDSPGLWKNGQRRVCCKDAAARGPEGAHHTSTHRECTSFSDQSYWLGFLGGSEVKTLPVMQETWIRSLGQEDPLEEGMATHSSILAWRILWTEEPGGLQSIHRVSKSWTWLKWFSIHACMSYWSASQNTMEPSGCA